MATIEELKSRARQIKNEVEDGRNTANRIGAMFEDLLEFEEETRERFDDLDAALNRILYGNP